MNIIEIALGEYGNKGITGTENNPEILKYFTETGFDYVKNDDTAWCAAFVNWVLFKAGKKGTESLLARNFLNYRTNTTQPKLGDIVVLWRINLKSIYGHVGFLIKETSNEVFLLGGNQNNQVNIMAFGKDTVLGYITP